MHTFSQDKFGLHNLGAGGKAAKRRLLPLVAVVVALGLATTTAPRAQGGPTVLVKSSDWNIRHGILHERYNFRANGTYDYLHSAGSQPIAVDSGTYTVQGDRLILRPAGGLRRSFAGGSGPRALSITNNLVFCI